jgi:hypothetical protein
MRRGDALRAVVLLLALSSAFADVLQFSKPIIVSGTGGLLYRLTEAT